MALDSTAKGRRSGAGALPSSGPGVRELRYQCSNRSCFAFAGLTQKGALCGGGSRFKVALQMHTLYTRTYLALYHSNSPPVSQSILGCAFFQSFRRGRLPKCCKYHDSGAEILVSQWFPAPWGRNSSFHNSFQYTSLPGCNKYDDLGTETLQLRSFQHT